MAFEFSFAGSVAVLIHALTSGVPFFLFDRALSQYLMIAVPVALFYYTLYCRYRRRWLR